MRTSCAAPTTPRSQAARTFKGLVGGGARVRRGSGEKQKEATVADFREAMDWLMKEAESPSAASATRAWAR